MTGPRQYGRGRYSASPLPADDRVEARGAEDSTGDDPLVARRVRTLVAHAVGPARLGNRFHVAPPLNVNDSDVATGLAILDEALAETDRFLA